MGAAAAAGAVAVGVLMWSQLGAAGSGIVAARPTTDAPTPSVAAPVSSSVASGVAAQAAAERRTEASDRPSESPAADPDPRAGESRPARTRQADRTSGHTSGRESDVSALPLATSGRVPLDRAVARFDVVLADGLADAEISPDAALDLKQVLHNSVSGRDVNGVAHIRTKLDDRLREGKLSVALMRRLGGAVEDVHTALTRSLA
ncbi:hypothetical protein [Microtetraspora malaysiensis]|uniref:hypothetical protein n=1 Tax=Microtetraspora malaysiensis TaxID=161358 RepID=UPI003D8BE4E1